jgi:transcriptional regulator with XRE-family HTH domain
MERDAVDGVRKEIGRRAQQFRLSRRLSQEDVAEKAGLDVTQVRRLEAGQNVEMDTFIKVCDGIGVTLREVCDRRSKPRTLGPEEKAQSEILKLLRNKDLRTYTLARDVLRDVISWKERYGVRR